MRADQVNLLISLSMYLALVIHWVCVCVCVCGSWLRLPKIGVTYPDGGEDHDNEEQSFEVTVDFNGHFLGLAVRRSRKDEKDNDTNHSYYHEEEA